ncbi:hypothetical protein N1851_018740 [Merluccius polli]|uniref:Uncharacterized protein n=1 Tax=Merluccius polli TaxID=89951 RepID=A0AA47MN79_MERPO|nr:hypothetical protein N1851_018740 [Merluccius polli]
MSKPQVLLRDQFCENVKDHMLRRELMRMVRQNGDLSLLDVRREAIRWVEEGQPTKEKYDLQDCKWLGLEAANGLDIPYLGYVEMDVQILDRVLQKRGILIVKDPPSGIIQSRKKAIPGILGMNIINDCYHELFEQYGPGLFQSPFVRAALPVWRRALRHCQRIETVIRCQVHMERAHHVSLLKTGFDPALPQRRVFGPLLVMRLLPHGWAGPVLGMVVLCWHLPGFLPVGQMHRTVTNDTSFIPHRTGVRRDLESHEKSNPWNHPHNTIFLNHDFRAVSNRLREMMIPLGYSGYPLRVPSSGLARNQLPWGRIPLYPPPIDVLMARTGRNLNRWILVGLFLPTRDSNPWGALRVRFHERPPVWLRPNSYKGASLALCGALPPQQDSNPRARKRETQWYIIIAHIILGTLFRIRTVAQKGVQAHHGQHHHLPPVYAAALDALLGFIPTPIACHMELEVESLTQKLNLQMAAKHRIKVLTWSMCYRVVERLAEENSVQVL